MNETRLSDSDLLLGIFHWQLGNINRSQLDRATEHHTRHPNGKTITDTLVELGFITDSARSEFNSLLNYHLDVIMSDHAFDTMNDLVSMMDQATSNSPTTPGPLDQNDSTW